MSRVQAIRACVGDGIVFVPIPHGRKGPILKDWPKLRLKDMTPEFCHSLESVNFGVLLGEPSGGICSIDFDCDEEFKRFFELNPHLRETLITRGARGGNVWVRVTDEYPSSAKLKTTSGTAVGEWRADGNQTVISGTHPSGKLYQNNGKRLLEVAFGSIRWPDELVLPWSARSKNAPTNGPVEGGFDIDQERDSHSLQGETPPAKGFVKGGLDSDLGRARLLVQEYGSEFRYVHAWGIWLVWNGYRWEVDRNGGIRRFAMALADQKLCEAVATLTSVNPAQIGEMLSRVQSVRGLASTVGIDRSLALVKDMEGVLVDLDEIDADPWIIGARNGCLDLRSGKVLPHELKRIVTLFVGTAIDVTAACPRWIKFLSEIFSAPDLIHWVKKAVGYCLTGETSEHALFFLYGAGANGKSTFLEVIQQLLGDYCTRVGDSLLRPNPHGREPDTQIAELFRRRMAIGSETEEGVPLAEKLVKDLTGSDTLRGRRLYAEAFTFRPTFKLWIYGNHMPVIRGTDDGIWRRLRIIPFTRQFTGTRQDTKLLPALLEELPGILNWAVQGCLDWQREGLEPPEAIMDAVARYRRAEDILGQFLAEATVPSPGAFTPSAVLWGSYQVWTAKMGDVQALTRNKFLGQMADRGYRRGHDSTGNQRGFHGIRLAAEF